MLLTPVRAPVRRGSSGQISGSPYFELSPTGRSTIPIGDSPWTPMFDDRIGFRSRPESGRYHDPRSVSQNYVDIDRIRCGLDVRTTVCFF